MSEYELNRTIHDAHDAPGLPEPVHDANSLCYLRGMARSLRQLLVDREAELGVSVADAAKLAGLDVRQYQKYRNDGVIPQGPQRKRLSEGLSLRPQELNDAIRELEFDEGAGEAYVKWLEEPASREAVQALEMKLLDIEKPQLHEEYRDLLHRGLGRPTR